MPDPQEFRRLAENCRWLLATEDLSVWGRHSLIDIADRWDQLALELEPTESFTKQTNVISLAQRRSMQEK
jgi:hypothetical protein